MERAEFNRAVWGLFVADFAGEGGIDDAVLKANVRKHLLSMDPESRDAVLSRFVRDVLLTEKNIAKGIGLADVAGFCDWIEKDMEISIYV